MNLMKMLLWALLLSVFACDDENSPSLDAMDADIEGPWTMTLFDVSGTVTNSIGGQNFSGTTSTVGTAYNATLTLKTDNRFEGQGTVDTETTIAVAGFPPTTATGMTSVLGTGTYMHDGNMLTVIQDGDTTIIEILELSNDMLHLRFEDTIIEELEGNTSVAELVANYKYIR